MSPGETVAMQCSPEGGLLPTMSLKGCQGEGAIFLCPMGHLDLVNKTHPRVSTLGQVIEAEGPANLQMGTLNSGVLRLGKEKEPRVSNWLLEGSWSRGGEEVCVAALPLPQMSGDCVITCKLRWLDWLLEL